MNNRFIKDDVNGEFTFIADEGHGWLRVPLDTVRALPVTITPYSYQDHEFAYLEEDCDLSAFIDAIGRPITYRAVHCRGESSVRGLPRYGA